MFAGIVFWGCLPICPLSGEEWDERGLPTCVLDDLDRFQGALLAMRHGAEPWKIQRYIEDLESRWWDTAGFKHEYDRELARLRWCYQCWDLLRQASLEGAWDSWRCARLRELRRLLGPTLYRMGRMPDYPTPALVFQSEPEPEFPG